MPYETKPSFYDDHGFALNAMWVGLAAAIWLLVGELFNSEINASPIVGVVAGSLIGLVFIGRQDEYFQRLVATAASWTCAVVGLWLFASAIPMTARYVIDHELGLTIVAATFHLAFAIARIRGTRGP